MRETFLGILMVFVFYFLIMFIWGIYMSAYGINIVAELLTDSRNKTPGP